MEIENFNNINKQEIINIISSKLDTYLKMYNDKEFCFKNFNKFNFYDVEYIKKITNDSFIDEYDFNNKMIRNVKDYIKEQLDINLIDYGFGNNYPKYVVRLNDYCTIDLQNRIIKTRLNRQIAFSKYIIDKNKKYIKELELKTPNEDLWLWMRDYRKNYKSKRVAYFNVVYNYIFFKKEAEEVHQIFINKHNEKLSLLKNNVKRDEQSIVELEQLRDEIDNCIYKLRKYNFEVIDEEIDEEYIIK